MFVVGRMVKFKEMKAPFERSFSTCRPPRSQSLRACRTLQDLLDIQWPYNKMMMMMMMMQLQATWSWLSNPYVQSCRLKPMFRKSAKSADYEYDEWGSSGHLIDIWQVAGVGLKSVLISWSPKRMMIRIDFNSLWWLIIRLGVNWEKVLCLIRTVSRPKWLSQSNLNCVDCFGVWIESTCQIWFCCQPHNPAALSPSNSGESVGDFVVVVKSFDIFTCGGYCASGALLVFNYCQYEYFVDIQVYTVYIGLGESYQFLKGMVRRKWQCLCRSIKLTHTQRVVFLSICVLPAMVIRKWFCWTLKHDNISQRKRLLKKYIFVFG